LGSIFGGSAKMFFLRWALAILGLVLPSASSFAEPIARLTTQRALDCEAPCKRAAVIFIHGITGSPKTWGDPSTPLYWPKMLSAEPSLSDDLDIYQIDYDGTKFLGPAAVAIESALELEVDKLLLERKYSKVIFIAHSLGGIFVRTYLLHVKLNYGHAALSRFRLVITLGTPNLGSSLANLARLASLNEQIRVLRPIDVNDFAQLVNKSLREIQTKHEGCLSLRSFAAFEKKPVLGLGIVVSEESATKDAFGKQGFNRNHIQLPKPQSTNPVDPVYGWATGLVEDCVKNANDVCPIDPIKIQPCPDGDFRPIIPN
jgi:pimeloyl-ACP methyl ester carboxylesterase